MVGFKYKNIGKFTCQESNGSSVLDYLFMDYHIWNILTSFEVHDISDFSDYYAVEFSNK